MNDLHRINSVEHSRAKPFWVACCLAVTILIGLAGIVWATSYSNLTAPSWNNGPQTWTFGGNVTYTGGEKTTCVSGTFTLQGGGSGSFGPITCGPSNTDPFTCTIPGSSVANAAGSIAYTLSSWTGNDSCTGSSSTGPSGSFASGGTGPNAVGLSRLAAARDASGWQMAAIAVLGLLGLGAGLWWARGRRQALAG
jgi:hypothetical protein